MTGLSLELENIVFWMDANHCKACGNDIKAAKQNSVFERYWNNLR